jgi:hypothetical protein
MQAPINGGRLWRRFAEPGKWYFEVDCLACNGPVPLAEAPSPDEKPDPLRDWSNEAITMRQSEFDKISAAPVDYPDAP